MYVRKTCDRSVVYSKRWVREGDVPAPARAEREAKRTLCQLARHSISDSFCSNKGECFIYNNNVVDVQLSVHYDMPLLH